MESVHLDAVTVVFEIQGFAPVELANALIEACSSAVLEGRCEIVPSGGARPDAARASVVWSDDSADATLSLTVEGATTTRVLHFRPADPPVERWRSVGLVAGTLASEAERRREETAHHPPPPPTARPELPRPKPAPPPARLPPFEHLTIDAGLLVGNGLSAGGPSVGGLLRLEGLLPLVPIVLAADFSLADRPSDGAGLSAQWFTSMASIGLRGGLLARSLSMEGRIGGMATWTGASISDAGQTDSGGRWQPGIGAGFEVAWMFSRRVGIAGGIDGSITPSATSIRVRNSAVARSPAERIAGYIGLRLGLL